jgi:KaiC/GvpD/RAD55 family RecA-like ATPase
LNLAIFKLLLSDPVVHGKYGRTVKEYVEQQDSKELKQIVNAIDMLHDQHEAETFTVSDLDIMLSKAYPNQPKTLLDPILERIRNEDANADLLAAYLTDLKTRKTAHQVALKALQVYETGSGTEELQALIQSLEGAEEQTESKSDFITKSLVELVEKFQSKPGLNWRLRTMNEMLGPLRPGNFGFVFARSETGKTTFLCSEVSHMAEQVGKMEGRTVLWVNNEEESTGVYFRMVQATLGITDSQLKANVKRCDELFNKKTNGCFHLNEENGSVTKRKIEQWCKDLNPALIIIDQLDKVDGFDAERYDLLMKAKYFWGRQLASKYGAAVIAVCQAGGTADNKKWLGLNDVDSSMTAKQGESDWILGIGKLLDDQYERVRFLHLLKNKLPGGDDSIPEMRHGKKEVLIKAETARYEDLK